MDKNQLRTLVLNSNYQPVDVFPLMTIPVEDAVTRCYSAKPTCRVELDYPYEIGNKHGNWSIKWPSIIVRHSTNIYHKQKVHLNHTTLYYRDLGECAYCGTYVRDGTIDHVVPTSKGGKNIWDNVVWCCHDCNQKKDNKMPEGVWKPKKRLWSPTFWELLRHRKKFPLVVHDIRWMDYLPDWEGEVRVHGVKEDE
jgi:5-methylcytosine-specific restriction endonuclease McrA